MQINNISAGLSNIIEKQSAKPVNQDAFNTYLDKAMGLWNETNNLDKEAKQIGQDYLLGKTDDIASVVLAQDKAQVALQFTTKVRDSLLDAFNEIMRMQV